MDPPPLFTLDAFSVELTQPLQTVAIWQQLVVAGAFFLVDPILHIFVDVFPKHFPKVAA